MSWAPFLAPNRDVGYMKGRPKQGSTVYFTIPGVGAINLIGTNTLTANLDVYSAFWVDLPVVIDQIAAEVTTGSAVNFRMGLYRADRDLQPIGAPVLDSGDIDATATGVKTYTPGTPVYLPPGPYLTVVNSAGTPTLRRWNGSAPGSGAVNTTLGAAGILRFLTVSRTYGAFPTPGTAWTTVDANTGSSFQHYVLLRVLAL